MSTTGFDTLDAQVGRFLVTASLPTTPSGYYGSTVGNDDWRGGEVVYNTADSRMYIQTATSGKTAIWKRLLDQFATSTTSSSTSTSTSTSTSSSSTTTA